MNPLISVLVPVFNHATFVRECLDSIAFGDYKNIEIIICDDGSTDDSVSIVRDWLSKNREINAILLTQENQGVCKTLNRMIKHSNGEYIALCASDDLLTKSSLSSRLDFLNSHPKFLACIGDANLIDQDSRVIEERAMVALYGASYRNLALDITSELVLRWSVVGPTLFIHRDAYKKFGLYDESLSVEDREFYLRLLAANVLIFFPNIVACYRIHDSNISRKSLTSRMKVIEQVAVSNLRHSYRFNFFLNLFLKTHNIDIYISNNFSKNTGYWLLVPFRVFRKIISAIILKAKCP